MQVRRARSAGLVSGLAILLGATALTAPGTAHAQVAAQQQGVVQRISVSGNERIEQSTILSYLPIALGDTVDPARIDLALKALFRTDLFSDVKVGLTGGELTIQVVENPIINRVVFEGNAGLKEDKLRDEITVRPRGIFTRAKVQADIQRIVELYRRQGRISAVVTPKIIELPQKRVDLIFEIDEGKKSGVLGVNFLGNSEFSDNDLRDVIVTEESAWYRFFSSNTNYDPDRLEYDKEQLRKHYRNRGFYDFRVISGVAELSPSQNGFAVTYSVEEGPEYKFGKISVETELKKLDTALLTQLVPIQSGEIYEDQRIETATDALTFAAGAAGFASVDVRPRYVADPKTRLVDVVFQVNEGPRVYVNRVDIVGNNQTLDQIIRRELNLVEGDAYNRALVDRSENNLRALGFFKDVNIEEIPTGNPDRTDLLVKVEEQATGELTFSAGYSSVDQLMIDVGITERNFRGRGQDARARVSWGSYRKTVDLSFTEPRFLGRNLRAGVDVYYFVYDLSEYSSYKTTTLGTNFRVGFPLTADSFMTMRYVLRDDDVQVPDYYCDPSQQQVSQTLCDQRGRYTTSLIGYQVTLDRRNSPVRPSRGFFISASQDFAGLGGDVKYIRNELEGGWYHGFNKDFVLSLSGSGGYISGWGDDAVRINDRFYKGGNSFRGFKVAGIGPRDTTYGRSDALGGEIFAIGSAELTVPTFIPQQYGIRASVFTDFGTLGKLDDSVKLDIDGNVIPGIYDDLSLRASAGLSIFWRSPMGPIRFDFSHILQQEDYDRDETFRFSQTTKF